MKKQLFILILAVFASATVAFGQYSTHNTAAQGLTCTDDALHPIAGKSYDYSVGVSPTGGNYQWWATKAYDFIQNGTVTNTSKLIVSPTQLIAAGAGNTETMSITWSSAILANTVLNTNPTFVAVTYDAPSGSCANNFKVYQIDPRNGFTVDIYNMNGTTLSSTLSWGATNSVCVSDVANAQWNGSQVIFDYGTTTLTYEIVAANFSDYWTPAFQVSGLAATESATIEWAYSPTGTAIASQSITNGATVTSTATAQVDGSVTNTNSGVSIYARLIIHHNNTERAASSPNVTLAVNGMNSVNQPDVVNTDCATVQNFEDTATQSLTPRPVVTATTPTGTFAPNNSQ